MPQATVQLRSTLDSTHRRQRVRSSTSAPFGELLKCVFQWPAAKDAVAKGALTAKTEISSVKMM